MNLGHLNVRSLSKKSAYVNQFIVDNEYDLFTVSETWHLSSKSVALREATPPGYECFDVARGGGRRGGGLALFARATIACTPLLSQPLPSFVTFEFAAFRVSSFVLVLVYSSPTKRCSATYLHELEDFIAIVQLAAGSSELVFLGDFNIHVDDHCSSDSKLFASLLNRSRLRNCIGCPPGSKIICSSLGRPVGSTPLTVPTHQGGHTLDLILCSEVSSFVAACNTEELVVEKSGKRLFDHRLIDCELDMPSPPRKQSIRRTLRSYRGFDVVTFLCQLVSLLSLLPSQIDDVDLYCTQLYSYMEQALNDNTSFQTIDTVVRPNSVWFNSACREAKRTVRRAERKYYRQKSPDRLDVLRAARNSYHSALCSAHEDYWKDQVLECDGAMPKVWKVYNRMTKRATSILPVRDSPDVLASDFADFFASKIATIRDHIPAVISDVDHRAVPPSILLDSFASVSSDELLGLLRSMKPDSRLDVFPDWLYRASLDALVPPLKLLFNTCLATGRFPSREKMAVIRPLLKQHNADSSKLSNYRPISTLSVFSKVLEKIVVSRVVDFLARNNLLPDSQSAYRKGHSTESALLQIHSRLLKSADDGFCSALVSLDMSAAFDTVDHDRLLYKLEHFFGFRSSALSFFESYLRDRSSCVAIDSHRSPSSNLVCGVPQGSCLGPLLFIMYTADVFDLVSKHSGFFCSSYADDIQLYCRLTDESSVARFEKLLEEVAVFMDLNKLHLNASKTQLCLFGTQQQLARRSEFSLNFRGTSITPESSVKILGVLFDSGLTFSEHADQVARTCRWQLAELSRIRDRLDRRSLSMLLHSFITSRIDYCNSLFVGCPESVLSSLQSVQNFAIRVLFGKGKRCEASPLLREAHWLPVRSRCQFKIALWCFKVVSGSAPPTVSGIVTPSSHQYSLRSSPQLAVVPQHRLSLFERSFAFSGPSMWQSLPNTLKAGGISIEVFKKRLKTLLFS